MASESCALQSPYINFLANFTRKQDKLIGAKNSIKKSNVDSNETLIKAFTPLKAFILPLVSPLTKYPFTRFIKVFIEII